MTDKSYSPNPSITGSNTLKFGIGSTGSAICQAQALFTKYPISLVNAGEWIQFTMTFTDTANLVDSANNYLGVGLFNGNQTQPVPGGMSAAANPLASSTNTKATGYAQNWQGYVGKLAWSGGANLFVARPAQAFADNRNQDLVGISFATAPAATNLAQTTSTLAALTQGQAYTVTYKITLTASGTLTALTSLYQGTDTTASPLQTITGTASSANSGYLGTSFDGLAFGWRAGNSNGATTMDVNSITIATTASTTVAPQITTQPSPTTQTVSAGSSVTYSVTATGGGAALTYQWQKSTDNGATYGNISGATNSSYSIGSVALGDTAMYRVQVTDVAGTTTSNAVTLNVASGPFAPQITAQPSPSSLTVVSGSSASFTVQVSGNPQPTVQWQKSTDNGANFSNVGTASQSSPNTYTIPSAQLSDTGLYRAVATNSQGSATSNTTSLTVTKAPTITSQPAGAIIASGSNYALTAGFTGTPAPAYQWQMSTDGLIFTNVAGATNSTYSATGGTTPSGYYRVIATNSAGSVTSSAVYFGVPTTQSVTFAPGNNATNISIDQQLRLVFPSAPKLGISGVITIKDAADNSVAATIDASQFVSYAPGNAFAVIPNAMIRNVQGSNGGTTATTSNYYYMPIAIYGNEVWITLGQRLAYGHTYYVTMDPALLLDSSNAAYMGVTGPTMWRFSTKASGPATPTASTGLTTITIGQDGTGDFATFQGAFDWIPLNNTLARTVRVKPGIYRDNATLGFSRNLVTIVGESSDRTAAQLIYPFAYFAPPLSVFTAGSLRIESNDVTVRDLTVDNIIYNEFHPTGFSSSGAPSAFAGAINTVATTGTRLIFDNVLIKGGQDTLYDITAKTACYFYKCEIWGSVDFIYGPALAVFDQCNIVEIRDVGGPVCAPSTDYAQPYGEVFLNCTFPRALKTNGYPFDVNTGSTTYMRPWRQDGAVAIINCSIGGTSTGTTQMSAKRWLEWNAAEGDKEVTCRAREYGTTFIGAGAAGVGTAYWNNTIDPDYSGPPMLPSDSSVAFGTGSSNRVTVTVNPADYTLSAIFGNSYFNLGGWMPSLIPRFMTQPAGQTVNPGANVTFTVVTSGTPSATYQWYKNGAAIAGATGSSYSIASAAGTDWGSYSVVAMNPAGSTTSSAASLVVNDPLAQWANSNGLDPATTGTPAADPDNDSLNNKMEFFLGGNPRSADNGILPVTTTIPGALVFEFNRNSAASAVAYTVEYTTDLSGVWTTAVHGQNGITIMTNANTGHITVTIPNNGAKLFARLRL